MGLDTTVRHLVQLETLFKGRFQRIEFCQKIREKSHDFRMVRWA